MASTSKTSNKATANLHSIGNPDGEILPSTSGEPNEQFIATNMKTYCRKSRRINTNIPVLASNKNDYETTHRPSCSKSSNTNEGFFQRKKRAATSSSSTTATSQGRDIMDEIEEVPDLSESSIGSFDTMMTRMGKGPAQSPQWENWIVRNSYSGNAASSSASPQLKSSSGTSVESRPSTSAALVKMQISTPPNEQSIATNMKTYGRKSRKINTNIPELVSNKNDNKNMKRPLDSEYSNKNEELSQRKKRATTSSSSTTANSQVRDIMDEIEDVHDFSDCSIGSTMMTRMRKVPYQSPHWENYIARNRYSGDAASSSASPQLKPSSGTSVESGPSTSAAVVKMQSSPPIEQSRLNTHMQDLVSNKNDYETIHRPSCSKSSNTNEGLFQRKKRAATSFSSTTATSQGRDIMDEIDNVHDLSDSSIRSFDTMMTRMGKGPALSPQWENWIARNSYPGDAASSSASPQLKSSSGTSVESRPSTSAALVKMQISTPPNEQSIETNMKTYGRQSRRINTHMPDLVSNKNDYESIRGTSGSEYSNTNEGFFQRKKRPAVSSTSTAATSHVRDIMDEDAHDLSDCFIGSVDTMMTIMEKVPAQLPQWQNWTARNGYSLNAASSSASPQLKSSSGTSVESRSSTSATLFEMLSSSPPIFQQIEPSIERNMKSCKPQRKRKNSNIPKVASKKKDNKSKKRPFDSEYSNTNEGVSNTKRAAPSSSSTTATSSYRDIIEEIEDVDDLSSCSVKSLDSLITRLRKLHAQKLENFIPKKKRNTGNAASSSASSQLNSSNSVGVESKPSTSNSASVESKPSTSNSASVESKPSTSNSASVESKPSTSAAPVKKRRYTRKARNKKDKKAEEAVKEKSFEEKYNEITLELKKLKDENLYLSGLVESLNNQLSLRLKFEDDVQKLIEEELMCNICTEIYVKAVTLGCSHTFCEHCISEWKKKQITCPICRKSVVTETNILVLDSYINKAVDHLDVETQKRRKELLVSREKKKG